MNILLYREPLGLPLRWQDDQSGQLPDAIKAFLGHSIDESNPLTETQLNLSIQWCRYYINAPCWMDAARHGNEETVRELQAVIDQAHQLHTAQDIQAWITACLELGIDPL